MATLFFGFHFFHQIPGFNIFPFFRSDQHTLIVGCVPDFSTALVVSPSTGLSSTDFTFITFFAMCPVEGVSRCCPIAYPHRWSASCGKNVRNMQFEPPDQKMCLFYSICLSPYVLNLVDSNFYSFISKRAP